MSQVDMVREVGGPEARVECFHRMLERRVEDWLATGEARCVPCAGLYRHLPGLFLFLTRVALDPRVPEVERRGVLAALKYVVAPFDLIPEGIVGTIGFRDDLVLAALIVDRLYSEVPADVLAEHWSTAGDPRTIARAVLTAAAEMVGPDLCDQLLDWLPR